MAERKVSPNQEALKTRKRVKKSKPEFDRSESWRYVRLKKSWRRPRGLDHKMRRKIKGWPPTVNTGYKGPKVARGLHPSGYREVLVHNPSDLSNIDPKFEAARIAHTVGRKKRVQIVAEAKKLEVFILNFTPVKETAEEEEAEAEETEATEEKPEKPEKSVEKNEKKEKKAAVKKAEKKVKKPKSSPLGRKKEPEKEKKVPTKKVEKPKATAKKAKAEKGVETQ